MHRITVYTNSANLAGESDELVEFLSYGKQCGALSKADTHVDPHLAVVFRLCDGAQRVQQAGPAVMAPNADWRFTGVRGFHGIRHARF